LSDFNILKNIVLKNNSFLVTTHVNPDADAIGSEIALYLLLKKLNKEVYVVNHSDTPESLQFLDVSSIIIKYDDNLHGYLFDKVDVLFALDFNQIDRIVSMAERFEKSDKLKVCIDHHQLPDKFVDYYFNGTHYSATGEIIYNFIKNTNIVSIDEEIALQLYAAIMTDTGSFRFERTASTTHLIAADLLEKDINPIWVYDKIYNQNNLSKIRLLGYALSGIKTTANGKIGYMVITKEMIESCGAVESEVDGFINYCMSIKDVKIGLLFMDVKQGIKISYRSKGEIPINELAAEFEGGGHTNAAGSRLYGCSIDDYLQKVINAAQKYLN
jgi:phosphoesterase RecJ-like protein